MRVLCLLAGLSAIWGFSGDDLKMRLDQDLSLCMQAFELPGLTVSVAKNGKLVYSGAFGVKNLKTREPMTVDAMFHTASVSKPFAATAVMHLVEQGKLDLDTPIITYLPYFKLAGESYQKITLRHILTHRSGMPDVSDYEWDKPQYDEGAAERYVRSITQEKPIGPIDGQYAYSNMAFDVLADLIHKVSGLPYEDYLERHILKPLGMKHSTFLKKKVPSGLATTPHVREDLELIVSKIYPYNRRHAPSSTLHANVLELARWGMANLNRGTLDGKRILKDASYDELFKPQAPTRGENQVGLSWFLSDFEGTQEIAHSGGDTGYRSNFAMYPEKGIAVAILCNSGQVPMGQLRNLVARAAFDLPRESIKMPISNPVRRTIKTKGIEAALATYRKLKQEAPETYDFGIGELYSLGYELLHFGRKAEAVAIMKLNVEIFPDHTGTQGALGEAYMLDGQTDLAIVHLKKAVAIDATNLRRKNMLDELLKKK